MLPRRWVVERTLAWLGRCRRLSKDYEALPSTNEGWVSVALTPLMLRRLARRARWRLRDRRQVVPWLRRYTLPGLCRLLPRLRIRWKRGRVVARGPVGWATGATRGGPGRCQCLTVLRRAYPAQTRLRGWANGPLHQHPTVLARAAQEAIPLRWRPTYAPWPNPIEQLWRWLTQEHLHHQRLATD